MSYSEERRNNPAVRDRARRELDNEADRLLIAKRLIEDAYGQVREIDSYNTLWNHAVKEIRHLKLFLDTIDLTRPNSTYIGNAAASGHYDW